MFAPIGCRGPFRTHKEFARARLARLRGPKRKPWRGDAASSGLASSSSRVPIRAADDQATRGMFFVK